MGKTTEENAPIFMKSKDVKEKFNDNVKDTHKASYVNKDVKKAVIPAGGFGTRLLPATKAIPKEMLPILDRPAIEYIVEEAIHSGIEEIFIITAGGKEAVLNHFDRDKELENALWKKGGKEEGDDDELLERVKRLSDIHVHYIRQKEPRGLGDAIMHARSFVGEEPFGVLLGDAIVKTREKRPCLKQLMDVYEKNSAGVVGVRQIDLEDSIKYGMIKGEKLGEKLKESKNIEGIENAGNLRNIEDYRNDECEDEVDEIVRIDSIIEKPSPDKTPSNLGTMGRYVFEPEIFDCLEETKPGVDGEVQLTDAIDIQARTGTVLAYTVKAIRYDTGSLMGYLKTMLEFGLEHEEVGPKLKEYIKTIQGGRSNEF